MNSGNPSTTLPRHGYIDTLRGLAMTLVIASHVKNFFPDMRWKIFSLASVGAHGVQLFFVVSALTLMLSWHGRGDGARRFYLRRLFRIAPMFWLALVVYTGLFALNLYPEGSTDWRDIGLTALFLHGFSPHAINLVVPGGWTIGAEMLFYALFPAIAATITTTPRALAFVVLSIAVSAAVNSALPGWLPDLTGRRQGLFLTYWFPSAVPSFACGCLAWHLLRQRTAPRAPVLLALMALGLMLVSAWMPVPWFATWHEPWSWEVLWSFASVCLVLSLAAHAPGWLVNPATRFVGKISFSGYLVHFLFYAPLFAWTGQIHLSAMNSFLAFIAALTALTAVTIAVSALTWRWIEVPGIALGQRLTARL